MASTLSIHSIERASQRSKDTGIELCLHALRAADDLTCALNEARTFVLERLTVLKGAGKPMFTYKSRRYKFSLEDDGMIGVTTLVDVGNKRAVIGIKGLSSKPVVITFLPRNKKLKSQL